MGHHDKFAWASEVEAVRRQHRDRRAGHQGPWGGPMGGPPPWVAQLFGPQFAGQFGGPGGPGGRGRGRARVRRGDVRSAILDVLHTSEEPLNGYQLIQEISERSEQAWKPSPGSVYPTIAQLEDEGLVETAPTGRRAMRLTAEGEQHVADHAEEMAAVWAPFASGDETPEATNFKQVIGQTVGAIAQVMSTGTPDQREKALAILADTRRRLYGLLAEGPEDEGPEDEDLDADDEER